jgi:hypothetical protein
MNAGLKCGCCGEPVAGTRRVWEKVESEKWKVKSERHNPNKDGLISVAIAKDITSTA